jgi:hypothetical protein
MELFFDGNRLSGLTEALPPLNEGRFLPLKGNRFFSGVDCFIYPVFYTILGERDATINRRSLCPLLRTKDREVFKPFKIKFWVRKFSGGAI